MNISSKYIIIIIFVITYCNAIGQFLDMESGKNISNMDGNELNAEWSPDSSKLLFQSDKDNQNSIYIYYTEKDTILMLANPNFDFRNPVWHPDGNSIVFDSEQDSVSFLYVFDLTTYKIRNLFNRKVECKNATFSSSSRQVYFNGLDELTGCWEIYSYDFVYDNLNKLTKTKFGVSDPDVVANGKLISISKTNPFNSNVTFKLINWYGEPVDGFNEVDGEYASWGPVGLKIYFIGDYDSKSELYSIWKNGSHLEKLTECKQEIASPAVSPDGTKIALSVKTDKGWDVFVLPFEDY